MQLTHSDFILDIYDDPNYSPESADNVIKYDHYYGSYNPERFRLIQHGIRVTNLDGELIKQVCVAASGGKTGIHQHCSVLLDNTLTICCADSVFSLTLPDLALRWQTKADLATCFQIFSYKNDFIIHGELDISRMNSDGQLIWQFSGNDIFVTPTGRDDFRIKGSMIYAVNWEEITFEIDAETGSLLRHSKIRLGRDRQCKKGMNFKGMSVIILETPINAKPEICYKLSLSVDLHQLSTQKTGEHIVDGVRRGIMKLGDTVTWKAKHFGIWQTLTTKITAEKRYEYFVDEMLQGAFKFMKHEHYFVETNDRTLMKDIFTFESPLGFFGRLFNSIILEDYMKRFLIERNETIKEIAESDKWKTFISAIDS